MRPTRAHAFIGLAAAIAAVPVLALQGGPTLASAGPPAPTTRPTVSAHRLPAPTTRPTAASATTRPAVTQHQSEPTAPVQARPLPAGSDDAAAPSGEECLKPTPGPDGATDRKCRFPATPRGDLEAHTRPDVSEPWCSVLPPPPDRWGIADPDCVLPAQTR